MGSQSKTKQSNSFEGEEDRLTVAATNALALDEDVRNLRRRVSTSHEDGDRRLGLGWRRRGGAGTSLEDAPLTVPSSP